MYAHHKQKVLARGLPSVTKSTQYSTQALRFKQDVACFLVVSNSLPKTVTFTYRTSIVFRVEVFAPVTPCEYNTMGRAYLLGVYRVSGA